MFAHAFKTGLLILGMLAAPVTLAQDDDWLGKLKKGEDGGDEEEPETEGDTDEDADSLENSEAVEEPSEEEEEEEDLAPEDDLHNDAPIELEDIRQEPPPQESEDVHIPEEDLLGSGERKPKSQTAQLEKPERSRSRLVTGLSFVGGGSILLLRGATLRSEMEADIWWDPITYEMGDAGRICVPCYESQKRTINSNLALGYALVGTGTILGFTGYQSPSSTEVALTWRGAW